MKALNEMYKTNKNAFLNYDKTAYTPEIKAKEEEVLAGMKAYKLRKEKEFNNNRAEGKEDNANSIRRYNAMEKAMNDLSVRIDYNKRLAKGFAPAAQPLVNDEPQAQAPNVKAKDAAPGNRPVINKETVNYLRALKIAASNARGILQDSDEYLSFCAAIDNVTDVTVSILHSRKKGLITDENNDYERYKKAVQHLKMSALDYEDYKLSDHTEDPENEPKKKKLNSDDRTKLKIVRTVLKNNPYFNIGEPVPDIVERKLTQAQDKLRSEKEKLGGQFPDRFNLRDQYATVAAANNIRIARKQGEFKHITEDKFDKVVDTFKKMPAFRKAMNEGTDEELFEHAVNKNGQLLYEDISKANRTLKNLEESTQAVHRNVKTLNQSDKTLGS